ncbi:MAG TPA: MdtA/MuxA family multidrug efflux RND transporter periplasmic adaptor subunit [Vicinamibacterales bacterium]|nr:MdtA/MuxA family multidrug efflux RND transporter periplasmic adaptor subunit [Vicinamibacterales bacterium]
MRARWLRRVLWVAAICAVVGLGLWAALHMGSTKKSPSDNKPAAIPVTEARAESGSINVYFTGLGSVTPLATITIKTRIDGQLMSVNYREGDTVRKGQTLVEIDPRPYQVQLEQAEGQLAKDQATLQNARTDLQRYEALITKNAIAQQILVTQRSTVAQDEGVVKTDQAAIDSAKLNLVYCSPTAPITGRVGLRLVDPGNYVSAAAGTPLAVITQMQPMSVIFTLPEDQVHAVIDRRRTHPGLRVDAMDRDLTKTLASGTLTTLDNQLDPTTGTLKLRATYSNENNALIPNQFVNARLLLQTKANVTLVPNAAVQRNGSNTFVYVIRPNHTVTVRKVTLGTVDAQRSEIASGVMPGEQVVTQGVDKLTEGALVEPQPSSNDNAATVP